MVVGREERLPFGPTPETRSKQRQPILKEEDKSGIHTFILKECNEEIDNGNRNESSREFFFCFFFFFRL